MRLIYAMSAIMNEQEQQSMVTGDDPGIKASAALELVRTTRLEPSFSVQLSFHMPVLLHTNSPQSQTPAHGEHYQSPTSLSAIQQVTH